MEILKTEKLSKSFIGNHAVKNINLTLEAGKVYGLLGPNGSGKSTLMKMIAGLCHPTTGDIEVMGEKRSNTSKNIVAYMPTELHFYDFMTIKSAGQYYKDFYPDFNNDTYSELIDFMGLKMSMKTATLSSGMRSKLKIAITMSRDSYLTMLDEPLNGVDIIARDKIVDSITCKRNSQNTMVISSHLVDEVEKIIDEVIFIKDGSIIEQGSAVNCVERYREIYRV